MDRATSKGISKEARAISRVVRTLITSITDRTIRIMVRVMAEIRIVEATVVQVTVAVTSGLQIHYVNVWEEICAVVFKVRRSRMGWNHDVGISYINNTGICY